MRHLRRRTGAGSATRRCTRPRRATSGVCHEHERELVMLYRRWEKASRSRLAGAGFKPPGAAAFKRRGGERPRKRHRQRCQLSIEEMSESKPSDDASLLPQNAVRTGDDHWLQISRDDTCLRSRRQSVYRRHELSTGLGMERENLVLDGKGNDKWQTP